MGLIFSLNWYCHYNPEVSPIIDPPEVSSHSSQIRLIGEQCMLQDPECETQWSKSVDEHQRLCVERLPITKQIHT